MRKLGLAAVVAASVAATGCATYPNQYGYDPYYNNGGYYNNGYYGQPNGSRAGKAVAGAAVGAVGGAIAVKIIPGVNNTTGSVAGAILGSRKGSRLYRSLVRERQIASDANAFTFDLSKGADILIADVTARPGISPEMLEQEVAREIDVMHRDGVSQEEVDGAVALIESDLVRAMQSAGDRADKLSMYATYFGKPELINEQPERYRAVKAKDVNRFVEARLGENNRVSLLYVPRDSDAAGEPLAAAAGAAS